MKNETIHFLIYEPDDGFNRIYLDMTVNEAVEMFKQTELLKLTAEFLTGILKEDYSFAVWKEGDLL